MTSSSPLLIGPPSGWGQTSIAEAFTLLGKTAVVDNPSPSVHSCESASTRTR